MAGKCRAGMRPRRSQYPTVFRSLPVASATRARPPSATMMPRASIEQQSWQYAIMSSRHQPMAWHLARDDYRAMAKNKRPNSYSVIQTAVGTRTQWARELVEGNRTAFARTLGVDASTLKKIETGERAPSIFNILELSNRLRVSTDFLLKGLLTARTDEEMALRLAALHPELVLQRQSMGSDKDIGRDVDDKPQKPMRPSANS